MTRRSFGFLIFAVVVSAICVRLGFWQLHRLAERRALNARLASRLTMPPVDVRTAIRDSNQAAFRRVSASGTYDFADQLSLASRTRQGSPGINLITPLRIAGTDTAVLVNRGWVYAADAMTADVARWKEPPEATVTGYLLELPRGVAGTITAQSNARVVRHLDYDSLTIRLPLPIARFMLVATDTASGVSATAVHDSTPARLPPPLMDEGPHLGYAIQWFAFAAIGLVGGTVAVRSDRRGSYHATGKAGATIQPSETRHG